MRGRRLGIVQEAQGDPAGGEILVDAPIVLRRGRRVARHAIGGAAHCACRAACAPARAAPATIDWCRSGRRRPAARSAAGVRLRPACRVGAAIAPWRKYSRGPGARRPARRRAGSWRRLRRLITAGARARDREFGAAQPVGLAHAGLGVVVIEALLHAHPVVLAGEHVAEQFAAPSARRPRCSPRSARRSARAPRAARGRPWRAARAPACSGPWPCSASGGRRRRARWRCRRRRSTARSRRGGGTAGRAARPDAAR